MPPRVLAIWAKTLRGQLSEKYISKLYLTFNLLKKAILKSFGIQFGLTEDGARN